MFENVDIVTNRTAFKIHLQLKVCKLHNKRQISRIYPKGTRVDSFNFMPQVIVEG
jgi:hypothetical protein